MSSSSVTYDLRELLERVCPFFLELDDRGCVVHASRAFISICSGLAIGDPLEVHGALHQDAPRAATPSSQWLLRIHAKPFLLRCQIIQYDAHTLLCATPWLATEDCDSRSCVDLTLAAPHETWPDYLVANQLLRLQQADLREIAQSRACSEARLKSVVDTASDCIIVVAADGTMCRVNPAVTRVFGSSFDLLEGTHVSLLIPQLREDKLWSAFVERTGCAPVECSGLRRDGTVIPLEVTVSSLGPDRSEYVIVARDVSERKRIDELKSQFISTVSHELRTPLTSIRGAVGLLLAGAGGALTSQGLHCIQIAHSNVERLAKLIDDILDSEKLDSAGFALDLEPLELKSLIDSTMRMASTYAQAHNVHLTSKGLATYVVANGDRLSQVLTNLLSNAVKFSPSGGTVEIDVERGPRFTRICVRDRGSGIPEEFRSRIFQRFAQADGSDRRNPGGSGLGLSIAKRLVEAMHGSIGFEPADAGGTIFFVDIPSASAPSRNELADTSTYSVSPRLSS